MSERFEIKRFSRSAGLTANDDAAKREPRAMNEAELERIKRVAIGTASFACLLSLATGCALKTTKGPSAAPPTYMRTTDDFTPIDPKPVSEPSAYFTLEGRPFCFAGTNNYYLTYKSEDMVLDVLDQARAMDLKVMRLWGFMDRGSLDGSVKSVDGDGTKDGVYFQYWDTEKKRPAYNEGPNGLPRLDFVLHHARSRGIKVLVVLTNNWRHFGGMDQYLAWYGLDKHDQFYTDPKVRQAYKDWVAYFLNRKNSIDGTVYKDDPAVFAWELANEPRARNDNEFDREDGWDITTITRWADEMSAYVKSIDPKHMVAVGDEGFLTSGMRHWAYEGPQGVDHEALTSLPNVDFGTYHLYPDDWGAGHRWGTRWIEDHIAIARKVGKPSLLEEYGIRVKRKDEMSGKVTSGFPRREVAYINWNRTVLAKGGAAALFWTLVGIDPQHGNYPDYDHFSVYAGDETFALLKDFAERFPTAQACSKPSDEAIPSSPFVSWQPPKGRKAPVASAWSVTLGDEG